MSERLKVLKESPKLSPFAEFKQNLEAKWDKKWAEIPVETSWEKRRLTLMHQLIDSHFQESFKEAIDLGCGDGKISKYLLSKKMEVDALDISKNALKYLEGIEGLTLFHEIVPKTKRADFAYDLVVAADIIAELPKQQFRLFFSEVSRLMKREALCLISTPLDYTTDHTVEIFLSLMSDEFDIIDLAVSHLSVYHQYLEKTRFKTNDFYLNVAEKMGKFFKGDRSRSHLIVVGKKRKIL